MLGFPCFCQILVQVFLRKVRIAFPHHWCVLNHRITIVNDRIKIIPLAIAVGLVQVSIQDITDFRIRPQTIYHIIRT